MTSHFQQILSTNIIKKCTTVLPKPQNFPNHKPPNKTLILSLERRNSKGQNDVSQLPSQIYSYNTTTMVIPSYNTTTMVIPGYTTTTMVVPGYTHILFHGSLSCVEFKIVFTPKRL